MQFIDLSMICAWGLVVHTPEKAQIVGKSGLRYALPFNKTALLGFRPLRLWSILCLICCRLAAINKALISCKNSGFAIIA